MIKFLMVTVALAAALTTGLYFGGPEFRTAVDRYWYDWTGWPVEPREKDPVGFMQYAERRLRADLAEMEAVRQRLLAELNGLETDQSRLTARLEYARNHAEAFREAYRRAVDVDGFPVEVRGDAYLREQVEREVGKLLAEIDGYRDALEHLAATRQQAEERLEAFSVQIEGTRSQLASMGVRREMVRAQSLSEQRQRVVAEVSGLMSENRATIDEPPVPVKRRQVEIERGGVTPRPSLKSAREFLEQRLDREAREDDPSPSDAKPNRKRNRPV